MRKQRQRLRREVSPLLPVILVGDCDASEGSVELDVMEGQESWIRCRLPG